MFDGRKPPEPRPVGAGRQAAMFGSSIGAGEILLILGVVLLLFGAQRLPSIARSLGRALEEFRRSAHDLSRDILNDSPPPPSSPPTASAPLPDPPTEDKQD